MDFLDLIIKNMYGLWITFQLKSIIDSYSCLESHLTVISNPMFTSEQQSRN